MYQDLLKTAFSLGKRGFFVRRNCGSPLTSGQPAPLVIVRPGELRPTEGIDIASTLAEWRYTVTKTDAPHIVPMSTQAILILREIQALTDSTKGALVGKAHERQRDRADRQ
jgi:hypothetical protein